MTSIIKFTSLQDSEAGDEPLCYLLQIDDFRMLLDCGWDEAMTPERLERLHRVAAQVHVVLLSHLDMRHLGALPYAMAKLGLKCPVYATTPVREMGRLTLLDAYWSRRNGEEFDLITPDDIEAAVSHITELRYQQPIALSGRGAGVIVTPYVAGHMVGGSIWRISKDDETVLYAVDYNHARERHLNGAVLESLSRPSILITDALNATTKLRMRKERDRDLLQLITETLRRNGNVLMPCDTAGRVLEILLLLDHAWAQLASYPLIFLSNVAGRVLTAARAQLEWLSDEILKRFESTHKNLFDLSYVRVCESIAEVDRHPSPKVVIATGADLCGFSLDLLLAWAAYPSNLVLFTTRPSVNSLAHRLLRLGDGPKRNIDVTYRRRVPLEGHELRAYLDKKREEQERAAEEAAIAAAAERRAGAADDEDSEDENINELSTRLRFRRDLFMASATAAAEADADAVATIRGGATVVPTADGVIVADSAGRPPLADHAGAGAGADVGVGAPGAGADSSTNAVARSMQTTSFFKQARVFPMFPYEEPKAKYDEYGEIIRPEEYTLVHEQQPNGSRDATAAQPPSNGLAARAGADGAVAEEVPEAPPTKCLQFQLNVPVEAYARYVDLEGRPDGESIQAILSNVSAQQLIIVHGDRASCAHLADYCRAKIRCKVHVPKVGECVDITSERNIYQVKLTDALVSALSMSRVHDCELAYVDGIIHMDANDAVGLATMDALPRSQVAAHRPVLIGELMLSDFKQVLARAGFRAEFSGGILICNDVVAIRKDQSGRITLEGALCSDYLAVRQLLYTQYAII